MNFQGVFLSLILSKSIQQALHGKQSSVFEQFFQDFQIPVGMLTFSGIQVCSFNQIRHLAGAAIQIDSKAEFFDDEITVCCENCFSPQIPVVAGSQQIGKLKSHSKLCLL